MAFQFNVVLDSNWQHICHSVSGMTWIQTLKYNRHSRSLGLINRNFLNVLQPLFSYFRKINTRSVALNCCHIGYTLVCWAHLVLYHSIIRGDAFWKYLIFILNKWWPIEVCRSANWALDHIRLFLFQIHYWRYCTYCLSTLQTFVYELGLASLKMLVYVKCQYFNVTAEALFLFCI